MESREVFNLKEAGTEEGMFKSTVVLTIPPELNLLLWSGGFSWLGGNT